jgi:L-aminopeptidase/D-esterase-like protein
VTRDIAEGSVGAGTGTTVGHLYGPAGAMKGGFGGATVTSGDGRVTVAALAVVNAFGDVRDTTGSILAGARARHGFADMSRVMLGAALPPPASFGELKLKNTTLCVIAASVPLSAGALAQVARAAGAALFRRITPAGTSFDGDVVFAVSPCEGEPSHLANLLIESLAVEALERAIERAVRTARGRDGIPGLADGD